MSIAIFFDSCKTFFYFRITACEWDNIHMYYYSVGIGTEKYWDTGSFTYSSESDITKRTLVRVPFGAKRKIGVVLSKTKKPIFKTKKIIEVIDIKISDSSLNFIDWYQKYYLAKGGQAFTQLLPGYLSKPKPILKTKEEESPALSLNDDQKKAVVKITTHSKPTILHGITGSGKTRIYIALILEQLAKGKNSLLLYPEISLSPQIMQELQKHTNTFIFHSGLSKAQRSKLWFHIATTDEPYVVIGTRSAIFLPYDNLGLVIIDEFHEVTFKQETGIRYNSVLTAGGLVKTHSAKLLLGSATPPVTETELVLSSGGNLVCLHEKAIKQSNQKNVEVIDKKNKKLFTNQFLLSTPLVKAISEGLENKQQSLLFINRRGTAKLVHCTSCEWQALCPDCELPVTYHHDEHRLICHTCGKKNALESSCPECGSTLEFKTFGSKAIVEEVQKIFPSAKIMRFDSDNSKADSFEVNYDAIKNGKIDIIIGTQQLVKGLDLPKLSTIGVIDADLSLHFPDFSSEERTFQLLSQVTGRVGRGHLDGKIFIQTFHINNPVIQLSTKENWHDFRKRELQIRKQHLFPPFTFIAKLIFRNKSLSNALESADRTKTILNNSKTGIEVSNPVPSFYAKKGVYYYVQIHLKSSSRRKILKSLKKLPKDILFELDPLTLL